MQRTFESSARVGVHIKFVATIAANAVFVLGAVGLDWAGCTAGALVVRIGVAHVREAHPGVVVQPVPWVAIDALIVPSSVRLGCALLALCTVPELASPALAGQVHFLEVPQVAELALVGPVPEVLLAALGARLVHARDLPRGDQFLRGRASPRDAGFGRQVQFVAVVAA